MAKALYRYVVRHIYGTGLYSYAGHMYHGLDDGVGLGEKNSIGYSVLCERIVDSTGIAEERSYTIAHYFQAFDCIINASCVHT